MSFMIQMTLLIFLLKGWCTEGDVISYTDSSIETVTEVEENGDFYTKNHIYAEIAIKEYGLRYSVRLVGTLVVFTALDLMAEHIKRL